MRRLASGIVVVLVIGLPAPAADKDKQKDKDKYAAGPEDYKALVDAGVAVGKVTQVEASTKGFTLIYQYQYTVPDQAKIDAANRSLNRQQQTILRQQQRALKIKNAGKRAARLQQLAAKLDNLQLKAADTSNLVMVKSGRKDFDLQALPDVKVRRMKLPVRYDDKGKVQEYTAREKKELKGKDPSLPGYEGAWDNVAEGQRVKVYLKARKKKKVNEKEPQKADQKKDKQKKDDEEDAAIDDDRPLVKMILILDEPDSDLPNDPKK